MDALFYPLFLLVIINFYLRIRKKDSLEAIQRFMISLMCIGLLYVFFYFSAQVFAKGIYKINNPTFNIIFFLTMNLVMPIVVTEIVLAVFKLFIKNRKK